MKTRSEARGDDPAAVLDGSNDVRAFQIAGGRVIGAEHRRTDRACQDALAWAYTADALIATVCDGCGSGRHSEVGAALGARLWTEAVAGILRQCPEPRRPEGAVAGSDSDSDSVSGSDSSPDHWTWDDVWRMARERVCTTLAQLVIAMGKPFGDTVADYFLFTVVSAAITSNTTAIHAIGDGVISLNGEVESLGPFPGNQPPYLAYDLLRGADDSSAAHGDFHRIIETCDVESLILASDGAGELDGDSGGIGQFSETRYFRNRDALRRRLAVINRETCDIDWQRNRVRRSRGALGDDTAVIAIRRDPDWPVAGDASSLEYGRRKLAGGRR